MWKASWARCRPTSKSAPNSPASAREGALTSMIRKQFAGDIRQQVLENLIPKFLQKQFEAENLNVVGTPDIKDVHFHEGEPLRFKAEFEVVPEIELGEYRGVEVALAIRRSPTKTSPSASRNCASRRRSTSTWIPGRWWTAISPWWLESLGGVVGEPVKTGRDGARNRRRGHVSRLHREPARLSPGGEGIRSRLPGDYGGAAGG
jgi:hypothetical protein